MLNGAALRCDEESKTELMGEDGDVSLVCLFTAPRGSEPTRFATTVTWSHAEYVGYSLSAR